MPFLRAIAPVLSASLAMGMCPSGSDSSFEKRIEVASSPDPAFEYWDHFRIADELDCAVELQRVNESTRAARLRAMAADSSVRHRLYVLCQMLFVRRDGRAMESARLGGPEYVGDDETSKFLFSNVDGFHDPLALFEGLPILLVRGYYLSGLPESASDYLEGCLAYGQWTTRRYQSMDEAQRRAIVERFLSTYSELRGDAAFLLHQAR